MGRKMVIVRERTKPESCLQNRNRLLIYKELQANNRVPGPGVPIHLPAVALEGIGLLPFRM